MYKNKGFLILTTLEKCNPFFFFFFGTILLRVKNPTSMSVDHNQDGDVWMVRTLGAESDESLKVGDRGVDRVTFDNNLQTKDLLLSYPNRRGH